MGFIGGKAGHALLRRIAPRQPDVASEILDHGNEASLTQLFGTSFAPAIAGRTVIDFGCGIGRQTIEMAQMGATRVIGLEIQSHLLEKARLSAAAAGLADRCTFSVTTNEVAEVIVSKDAFEHFSDPHAVLSTMAQLLSPGGCVLAAFGPTWLHPYGGHLFSVFPWSHLVFTERAQIQWRSEFKSDGATRFSEVAGGLNQMTIARFETLVARSAFQLAALETVPIRGVGLFRSRLLREFGSSIVRCRLELKSQASAGA